MIIGQTCSSARRDTRCAPGTGPGQAHPVQPYYHSSAVNIGPASATKYTFIMHIGLAPSVDTLLCKAHWCSMQVAQGLRTKSKGLYMTPILLTLDDCAE